MDVLQRGRDDVAPHMRGLVLALMGDLARDPADADTLIAAARRLGVDPMDYCMHRLGLTEAMVCERAARWAGLAFFATVPRLAAGSPQLRRIDQLHGIRTMRAHVLDREVTFCAPRSAELIRLGQSTAANPDIARRVCIVPARALRSALVEASSDELLAEARQRLTRRWPFASADVDLPVATRAVFVVLFVLLTLAAAFGPLLMSGLLLPVIAILFGVPAALRLAAVMVRPPRPAPVSLLADSDLPVYTLLIPLRDEAEMVPLLARAMSALDYPPEKLDIKFVVERKSTATVDAVREVVAADARFELVAIPDAAPYTKPKALNYALPMVRGSLLVVYDAEDIPAPGQLRLAASRFAAEPGIDCLQAELAIDNAEENPLTSLFAAEYAGQFGIMLPFLGHHRLPMPLGGTSNHFRVTALRELGHWDAFNVTEDADLGVRLSRLRYAADTLPSETGEEAPITLGAWMVQRTRWIKGWMQTFIVHNRSPRRFLADIGWRNFLFFEVYVGGLILSALLHTVFVATLLAKGLFGVWPETDSPIAVTYLAILAVGYGAATALVVAGIAKRRAWRLLPAQLLLPLYWLLHSIAALRAAWELLRRPYFWGKTTHGRTRMVRRFGPRQDAAAYRS